MAALGIGYADGNIPYTEGCWPLATFKIHVVTFQCVTVTGGKNAFNPGL
jgi:hypothetical protein